MKKFNHLLSYVIVVACIVNIIVNWKEPNVAMAWLVGLTGWLSLIMERRK